MLLYFQEFGESSPTDKTVVLLHGLFGMSDNLNVLAKTLAQHCRVIVPDLINHGQSPHSSEMNYTSMANDVALLLAHLDINQCDVMGHSMGGKVAMQLAHDNSALVRRLVIADIAPVTYKPRHKSIIKAMFEVDQASIHQRREADAILSKQLTELPLRQFFLKNMFKGDDAQWHWRFGLHEISTAYEALSAAPRLEHVVDIPVLFIKGGDSDYIQENAQKPIQKYFPQAQLKVIAGVGHWLHAEKPLIFNRLVARFLLEKE